MFEIAKYGFSITVALLPVLIWWYMFRRNIDQKQRRVTAWTFLIGILSPIPILKLYEYWASLNEIVSIEDLQQPSTVRVLIAFAIAGFLEEVVKFLVMRYSDKFIYEIKTINESVKLGIFAALGFAFSENILYFSRLVGVASILDTFVIVVFRSLFTICAHMVFSGILGYYYSIAKFAAPFIEQEKWEGKRYRLIEFLNAHFHIEKSALYRKLKIFSGVIIAASMHALFNFLLDSQLLNYAVFLVVLGFVYVYYLMSRKAGHLLLGYSSQRKSLMAGGDEDVVIELLGMWINDGKFAEVEDICNRLLERDPDNKIVKIFLAKAHEKKKLRHALNSIKALFSTKEAEVEKSMFEEGKKEKTETDEAQKKNDQESKGEG